MAFDFSTLESNYKQVQQVLADNLKQIKTGRAKPAMVEDITAEAYGTFMPLKELASISTPDAQLILISPWDQSVVAPIEKALQKNNFNPSVDGNTIRVAIPPLTGETRQEMIKQVAMQVESAKQMLRAERTEGKKQIEALKGGDGVSEDDIKSDLEKLDKLTHDFQAKLEADGQAKKTELETL